MKYRIKDPSLAAEGKKKIDWAEVHMPVLFNLKKKFKLNLFHQKKVMVMLPLLFFSSFKYFF